MYHFYLLIFFILIFLACDILEKKKKRKARIGIKRRWSGKKLTPTCFGLPSVKSVPVWRKVNCVLYIYFLPTLSSNFPRVTQDSRDESACIYIVTSFSSSKMVAYILNGFAIIILEIRSRSNTLVFQLAFSM